MKGEALLIPSVAPNSCSSRTMRVLVLIAVQMTLLGAITGTDVKDERISLFKCCDVDQMLSADGESCEYANWFSNFSIKRGVRYFKAPVDSDWVRLWLPLGLPMENVSLVVVNTISLTHDSIVASVNASCLWDPALLEKGDLLKSTIAFLEGMNVIARPQPGGRFRTARYCVDAAPEPLGPFVVQMKTFCSDQECAYKCCWRNKLMKDNKVRWDCEGDAEGFWAPHKSSLTSLDREFPSYSGPVENIVYQFCEDPLLLPLEERYAEWALETAGRHDFLFSSQFTCFDFYRRGNSSFHEGIFTCANSRITRGVYWLLRPLCFLSGLLLLLSLLTVECDKNMRRKMHGRCLACHAACLLAFNVGQIGYYLSVSDRLDKRGKDLIPHDLMPLCKHFALSMYFVLTAAWFWLTALCVNMARGFRLHMPRLNKESRKKILVISAFAWGLPAGLTITCFILFTQPNMRETPSWYTPSLMETRVCYIEPLDLRGLVTFSTVPYLKSGTALFYYGPVFCLVMCNIICLVVTLRKVQYLKQGNAVLRLAEDRVPLLQSHTGGDDPPTAHTASGSEQTPPGRKRRGTAADAKTIKLYIKMVLISGGIELLTEVIMWLTTHENLSIPDPSKSYSRNDRDMAYRAAGYVTDFFRAAVVTWLAAPEGGYLGLIRRMLRRGKREKKSAGAGNTGRRKHNVA